MLNLPNKEPPAVGWLSKGNTAARLLLAFLVIIIAAVWITRGVVFYQAWEGACAFVPDYPPWDCVLPGESVKDAGVVGYIRLAFFVLALVVFALFAVSLALWARSIGGGLPLLFLGVIGIGEMTILDIWQGYAGSAADKITDYLYGVLILWLAIAWHGRRIKEWLEDAIKKAVQAPINTAKETMDRAAQTFKNAADGVAEAVQVPVNAAKETMDRAAQTFKDAADNVADSMKGFYERASSKMREGVDYAGEKTTAAGKAIIQAPVQAASAVKDGVTVAASKVGEKTTAAGQAIAKVPGQVASATKDGATAVVSKVGDGMDYFGEKTNAAGKAIVQAPAQAVSAVKDGATAVAGVFSSNNEQSGKGEDGNDADTKKSRRRFGKTGKK